MLYDRQGILRCYGAHRERRQLASAVTTGATFMPVRSHVSFGIPQQFRELFKAVIEIAQDDLDKAIDLIDRI
jgi:hypothetical protein